MMINQGGAIDTITAVDTNSLEGQNNQAADSNQAHLASYYTPSTGSAVSWTMHRADSFPLGNGYLSNPSYHHDQHAEPPLSVASASSSVSSNAPQDYSSYSAYPSTDPYGYNTTAYTGYYSGYQHPNTSYPQSVGAYQSSGAPYQPFSSFQNTGSYPGPPNYSSASYNPGDYQTSGGYPSDGYNNQANYWHQGNYATYTSQYPNCTSDSNSAYSYSNAPAASQQYQQQYKQWADYYSQTDVTCAPGTENVSAPSTSNLVCPVPGVAGGYSASNSQPPASFTPSCRPDSNPPAVPSVQSGQAFSNAYDGYWKHGASEFQNHHVNSVTSVQSTFHKPSDANLAYGSLQEQQKPVGPQGPSALYPATHQVAQSYQSSLQMVSQTVMPTDTNRVSKLQIPTNPRIAPNFMLGIPKTDKDSSMTTPAVKPAYINVSLPKSYEKVPSHDTADSILKPGMFPKSLHGYVERALARCKDDAERVACQAVMKEVITKANADGTLYTWDWDTEPLFPLPNQDAVTKESLVAPVLLLPKNKKSPSRRSKSRWEPVPDDKLSDKSASVTYNTVKYFGWGHPNGKDKEFSGGKTDNRDDRLKNVKFSLLDQKTANINAPRPSKKQRIVDGPVAADNGDTSSDSDKEQSLTAHYSGAIALADSPEEKKRRENRSKRFEKGRGNRSENNHFRPKNFETGNLYTRRAIALVLSKNFEEGGRKPVEDIDWDSLTVKGTCQEIEKRYLRLTSAPDPATVRPEEVLEKALLMVPNSQKNYLYKCDQLKSIRQDLTVQRIRNELTVKVYETHARLAIEAGDLFEYNQCQSQLKTLYAEGIKGCHMEFASYNLLCVILHSYNNRELLSAMSRLSAEARKDEAIKHALAVRAAVTSGNYILFFRLYRTAPNLNTCLMDLYVEKMRYAAVRCMSRSYRPAVPVSYISQVLGFTSVFPSTESSEEKDRDGLEECIEWLKTHGACLTADNSGEMLLDAKASTSSLYMPEPEDAVAHGDASLGVDDFLTRNSG